MSSSKCEACGKNLNTSLTVDAGVLRKDAHGDLEVLLIQRAQEPFVVT